MNNELLEPNNLFSHIKPLRQALGLSSAEAAKMIGKPEAEYLAIENGLNTDCITLIRIANLYCCSTDYALSFYGDFGKHEQLLFEKTKLAKLHSYFNQLSSEEQEKVVDYAGSFLPEP